MELNFKFSVEEVNAILQALGGRPYAEVQALIAKIKNHGEAQIAKIKDHGEAQIAAQADPAPVVESEPISGV
jgi:hypothetical protein